MRHIICFLLAAVSFSWQIRGQSTTTRPRYGGVLRVETRYPAQTIDPAAGPGDCPLCGRLAGLVFDRLVQLDEAGTLRPALALSWKYDTAEGRWRFRLRPGVKFHDGSPLTADAAATAMGAISRQYQFSAAGLDEIVVQAPATARVDMEMAEGPFYVFLRVADGSLSGTGPYRTAPSPAPRRSLLLANEEHWAGRPFLDSVTVEAGRPVRDQLLDLELGKTDVIDVLPGDARRVAERGGVLWTSAPSVLLALRISASHPPLDRNATREALALSIDRDAILSVLLQKQGEAAGALLPQWLSGHAFLLPPPYAPARARQLLPAPAPAQVMTLVVDPWDSLARLVADRIAVNAREVGLSLQVGLRGSGQPAPDIELLRIPITSMRPGAALTALTAALKLPLAGAETPAALFEQEGSLVADYRIIPLFHVPELSASNPRVKTWNTAGLGRLGEWHFEDVWLERGTP
jgi:peptide/nickel transport system substrate-binding protein